MTGESDSGPQGRGRAVAVIPARGGSKRIPRKNLRDFSGKPILAWSIEAARASGCFSEVIVTTDDAEIAAVAKEFGASVPFLRTEDLSDDRTGLAPVVADALDRAAPNFAQACCLLATAPLLQPRHLARAQWLLGEGSEGTMVFSAVRYSHPVQRGFRLEGDRASMIFPEHQLTRSQDLEPTFHDAGQFYFFSVPWFRACGGFVFDRARVIELPETEVQDIDTEADWQLAEMKWQRLGGRGGPRR